uniref:Transposase n=1 Tax=Fagus sylvatica TaxID=28930 RepID=A0A2N9J4U7_FAGSY
MDSTYTTWVLHGERQSEFVQCADVEMPESYNMYKEVFFQGDNVAEPTHERRDEEFTNLVEDAETPLYSGCKKYTRMSATVVLFKHKATNSLSDKSFNELLEIIRDMLPQDNTLPDSLYSTKKILKIFDLGYEKIDACVNDCCLFRKEFENLEACPKCRSSRWKVNKHNKKIYYGVPAKVLRYFPIIPRLKRMFGSLEMAEQLTWHATHQSQDNKIRHPVDSLAWKTINSKWPSFASDPRNLRFGLSSDGFNPFKDLSSRYSCWPVILVTYNLPPWLCMVKENLMLTLLIPGPKQPGNDIDVYLEPLVEDLNELWSNGVNVYDAFSKSMFNLKAMLMWTINDFPAYGNLSGYSTKGKTLLVRHNLDVMHIEKNICESIIGTLLNVKGKSKDGLKSRMDLEDMKIRNELKKIQNCTQSSTTQPVENTIKDDAIAQKTAAPGSRAVGLFSAFMDGFSNFLALILVSSDKILMNRKNLVVDEVALFKMGQAFWKLVVRIEKTLNKGCRRGFLVGGPFLGADSGQLGYAFDEPKEPASR